MAKQNAINKGRSGEGTVVQLLNKWAGKKIFERRGLGKKGSDIICKDPDWPWVIECKATEYDFWGLGKILVKEAEKKGYSMNKTFFIFRHKRKIFIASSISWWIYNKQSLRVSSIIVHTIQQINCYLLKDFLANIKYEELISY